MIVVSGIIGITLIGVIIKLLLCMCVSRYFPINSSPPSIKFLVNPYYLKT